MIFTITIMIRDLVVRCGEWDTQTEGEPLDHQVTLNSLISKMIKIALLFMVIKIYMVAITQHDDYS